MKNLGIYTIIRNIVRRTPTTFQLLSISAFQLKKMLSIFLVMAIFFNGFIPKSAEFKNNLKEAISCAVETQTNFLDKYADSVVSVTNGIAGNVLNALSKAGLVGEKISNEEEQTATNNKQDKKTEPINTSADNCIITGNNTNNTNMLNELKTKLTGLAYSKDDNERNLYRDMVLVHTNGTTETGILFFILFAILVVRIKDTIAVLYNKNRIVVINRLG